MKLIITHRNPDLDAVSGVYLYVRINGLNWQEWNVDYYPARGDVYIDCFPDNIYNTEKKVIYDHHKKNTAYKSAAEVVLKALEHKVTSVDELQAYYKIVDAVNLIDQAKFPPREYLPVLFDTYINGLNILKLNSEDFWEKIFDFYDVVLESLLLTIRSRRVPYRVENVNNWKIIYYELQKGENINPSSYYFSELNADFIVYKQGNNIGITRNNNLISPSLEFLKDYIDEEGWFYHPQGFMASWGTAKYPAKNPSKYSIYDLVEILKEFLKNYYKKEEKYGRKIIRN